MSCRCARAINSCERPNLLPRTHHHVSVHLLATWCGAEYRRPPVSRMADFRVPSSIPLLHHQVF